MLFLTIQEKIIVTGRQMNSEINNVPVNQVNDNSDSHCRVFRNNESQKNDEIFHTDFISLSDFFSRYRFFYESL